MVLAPSTRYQNLTITDRELFDRLRWFTHVRWVFGVFCLVLLLVSWRGLGVRFVAADGSPLLAPAVHVIFGLFLCNAVFTLVNRILRAREQITRRMIEWIALAQILCDVIVICLLVHRTGGVENIFVILVLVPIVIVTELLPQRVAYLTAGIAAMMLNFVAWGEQQGLLPHVHVRLAGVSPAVVDGLYANRLYVLHVTAALTVTIFGMVFIASTIAARLRRREVELEKAYDQLRAADEAKSFFMRKAGHEMRAPLSAIHSILDAVSTVNRDLPAEQLSLIDRARHRCRAMMGLVNDLLRYSRLRAPLDSFRPGRVALHEIVNNTVQLMRERAEAAGLTLACDAPRLVLEGDEEMLRQLITNLVSNAIQYTPAGGSIDVALSPEKDAATLTVADTGIGIGEATRKRLFEEFYRAPEARETFRDGTGLGLAICKRIVNLHGGTIEVSPRPEGGTTFTVHLPLRRPQTPAIT